jgi:hypothetical protein
MENVDSAKKRLLAYYKRAYNNDAFPIDKFLATNEKEFIYRQLLVDTKEYLINGYLLKGDLYLLISSRKLIFINEKNNFNIPLEKVQAVFLRFPFKQNGQPHKLDILIEGDINISIEFLDINSLTQARNELYRIINAIIINWRGSKAQVEQLNNKITLQIPSEFDTLSQLLNRT